MNSTVNLGVLRLPAVENMVGLKRSCIYSLIQRGEFPKPIRLSVRAVGWLRSDVEEWLHSRIARTN